LDGVKWFFWTLVGDNPASPFRNTLHFTVSVLNFGVLLIIIHAKQRQAFKDFQPRFQ